MTKLVVGIIFIFSGLLLAQDNQDLYPSFYLKQYEKITSAFIEPSEWRTHMSLDRKIAESEKHDIIDQKIEYFLTDENFLKISVKQLIRNIVLDEEYFYYSPDGKLIMAETISKHNIKYIYLYDDDNPIYYAKVKKVNGAFKYDELDFKELAKGEEYDAKALLNESINFYNATQDYLDTLPH
ncbi:MAG: hypothetical protein P8Y99_10070 [Calditrichaceae bacterium]